MNFELTNGPLHCRFSGELNSDVCAQLEPELAQRIEEEQKKCPDLSLVFDLKDVTMITSAFLRLCIRFSKQVGAKRFCVVNLNDMAKRVFTTSGLLGIMALTSKGTQFDNQG